MAGARGRRCRDAGDGGPPARPACHRRPGARPGAAQPGRRLRHRRLGDADLRAARVLRVGRLAGGPADGGAAAFPGAHAPRARERPLDRGRTGSRRRHRGDAGRPARRPRGQQSLVRDERPDADRSLPRAKGQRPRPPLPVAGGRGDGRPARTLRTRLRPDRSGRAGLRAARGRRGRGRRGARAQGRRHGRAGAAGRDQHRLRQQAQGQPRRAGRVARSRTGGRVARRGPGRGLEDAAARARRGRAGPGGARGGPGARGMGAARGVHARGGDLPLAARSGQRPRPGQAALRLRLRVGGLQARGQAHVRLLHDADPVGRPAGRAVRSEAGSGDRHARDPRAVAGGPGSREGRRPSPTRWWPGCAGS